MKKLRTLMLVGVALAMLGPMTVHAQALPYAWFQVGGGDIHYLTSDMWVHDGDMYYLSFNYETSSYRVSGATATKFDPYISYGFNAQNTTGGDLDFAFGIISPIIPLDMETIAYASFSGSGTDVSGDGIHFAALGPDDDGDGIVEAQRAYLNGTNIGVDVGQSYDHGPGPAGASYLLGEWASGPQEGPYVGAWDNLSTVLNFRLSGANDIATLNGYASVEPVPEPASLLLLGGGLIGAALYGYRRRRA